MICIEDGCGKGEIARGWCPTHYSRWFRHGSPYLPTEEERFWPKVNKDGPIPEYAPHLGPCWVWAAHRSPDGYGTFTSDGTSRNAHRVSYQMLIGDIPAGLQLDHLCRVRHCVNPAHLEPVTCRENLMRGDTAAARIFATVCHRGHPFDERNTRIRSNGRRRCRICERDRMRAQRATRRKSVA